MPRRQDLSYVMRVAGTRIADMSLSISCAGGLALVEADIRNRGLAAFFAGANRTTMTALVAFDEAREPRPNRFRASYQKPDRLRQTELDFAPDGSLVHLRTLNRGREQESPVPEELREPSIDPLSALLRMGRWVGEAAEPGASLTLPLFEGRKRGDLTIVYRGPATLETSGGQRDTHHLEAALKGLSGFDSDDAFVSLPGEPPQWLDVHASREPLPVPLLIATRDRRLAARIELV